MKKKIILLFIILAFIMGAYALDFDPNPDVIIYDHENVHNFGRSVAVCDINNDTHQDLIIGADQGNNTVYVYYGGPFDRTPDIIIRPPNISGYNVDAFGYVVLCNGDLNNDSVTDLVVSDSVNNRVTFVYFGETNFNGTMSIILIDQRVVLFGEGDLNDDGVDDLVTLGYNSTSFTGVFVFYGGTSFNNVSDLRFRESASSYGYSLSAEGDLNDDGVNDLVIGGYYGQVWVYYGGSSLNNVSDIIISGLGSGAGMVVTSGDLNGDSVADLAVSGGSNTTIFFGGYDFDNTTDLYISGVTVGSSAPYAMLSKADLNNDGFNDLVIGTSSRVYLYYGGTQLDNISDVNISRTGITNFGKSMAAGDLNEDGVNDIIIGASTWIFGGEDSNKIYIYYGATSPLTQEIHETWSRLNEPQPTIVTLQGKLTNSTTGNPVNITSSMRVTITNSTNNQIWQDVFNNVIDSNGVFNIPLGASTELNLISGRIYNIKVEIDVGSTTFSTADVTFGDGTPAGDLIKFMA